MPIVHLIDDTTAGGITRFLEYLTSASALPEQQVLSVRRGRWSAPNVEADLIVSHIALSWRTMPMLVALRAKHPGTPLVHVEHHYTREFAATEARRQLRFETMLRATYSLFDQVVAVSHAQAAWLSDRALLNDGELQIISPAVELSTYEQIRPVSGPIHKIVALGRLDQVKGFDILIRAVSQCPGIELHIHGDGVEEQRLRHLAGGLPVVFHGHSDPVEAIAAADAVAIPSRRETFCLVALEARAAGRMVLVSGAGGLEDHVTGGAIKVGSDISQWTEILNKLDALQSTQRIDAARRDALLAGVRCVTQWQQLFSRYVEVEDQVVAA